MDFIWIAVIIAGFAIWWTGVGYLNRTGVLKKYNISAYGPLLMWRTYRGQKFLDMLAVPKKFWKVLITACSPMIVIAMLLMLVMIITVDIVMIVQTPEPGPANAPQNILAIPGLNEYIPFLWGWIALIVAMVVHEFGHAILAKVENIKVKSLGLLLAPVPIGAFAEIDEEELFGTKSGDAKNEILGPMETKTADSGERKASSMALVRILGAGVITNFLVAIIAFAILFYPVLGAIAATNSDMVVVNIAPGSPADLAGMKKNMIVTSVDGMNVTSAEELNAYMRTKAGGNATISGLQGNKPVSYEVPVSSTEGLYIVGVLSGYPGAEAGLKPNMKMLSINGTPINSYEDFNNYMNNTTAGQNITIGYLGQDGKPGSATLTLAQSSDPGIKKGLVGFSSADLSDNPAGMSVGTFMAEEHLEWLRSLPSSIPGWFLILFLPVWEVSGGLVGFGIFQSDLASLYYPVGWAAPLGNTVFYLAVCLFWIGWLNFNIALFNCLPMIPLDGGHIFREVTRMFIGKFVRDTEKAERVSRAIVNGFAITLFASLVFMIIAPYIVHGLA